MAKKRVLFCLGALPLWCGRDISGHKIVAHHFCGLLVCGTFLHRTFIHLSCRSTGETGGGTLDPAAAVQNYGEAIVVHHWMAIYDLNHCVRRMDAVFKVLVVVRTVHDGETRTCRGANRVSSLL